MWDVFSIGVGPAIAWRAQKWHAGEGYAAKVVRLDGWRKVVRTTPAPRPRAWRLMVPLGPRSWAEVEVARSSKTINLVDEMIGAALGLANSQKRWTVLAY